LGPRFNELAAALAGQRVELAESAAGAQPERVLVLEIVGTVDGFINAVRKAGFEWLAEWDSEVIAPDDDFRETDRADQELTGRLFLIMSNQAAMTQLMSLWQLYVSDQGKFPHGFARWRHVFDRLKIVRPWDVEDRLAERGALEQWQATISVGQQTARFEAELWFRATSNRRDTARDAFAATISSVGGQVIREAVVPEIAYHGLLAEVPIQTIASVIAQHDSVAWVRSDDVMFFNPVGQTIVEVASTAELSEVAAPDFGGVTSQPVIALLDGMPLQNHELLAGRLLVDDPDDFAANYPASHRLHGTAMASTIVWGDLSGPLTPVRRPLYVRPVMRPILEWPQSRAERIPEDELTVDLIHRSVRRMFESEADSTAVAPSVRVINLSLGDPVRIFDRQLSSWARLIDWLASRYQVLFVVSAGNHLQPLMIDAPSDDILKLPSEDLEVAVLQAIEQDARNRRLLSPAESINALTVAAIHSDTSTAAAEGPRLDATASLDAVSPINALGLGFRRGIKPDVLLPGGRQLFIRPPAGTGPPTALEIARNDERAPGVQVASPGTTPGALRATRYMRGTSIAAAIASRAADSLLDVIENVREDWGPDAIPNGFEAVMIKALLVHGANWAGSFEILERALRNPANSPNFREHVARYLGYGRVAIDRVISSTSQRATLIRANSIGTDERHAYSVPLPPSLSGKAVWRRLTITLAWLSPINPLSRGYRVGALSFQPPMAELLLQRIEADGIAVRRGTVQHEVLDGVQAAAYVDGNALSIHVDCKEDSGSLSEAVPYGLAVTVEVRQVVNLPIYEEIRERIRLAVQIRPSARS